MQNIECLIIGAGPAGLSAAIYTSRAGVKTQVIGCDPKVAGDYEIDNYFGFDTTISGKELIARGRRQALRFGAGVSCDKVLSVHPHEDGTFQVKTETGEYHTCCLILATGVSRIRPNIKNLATYEGRGVSYCVYCDGFFYRQKPVAVLGEGNYAGNQALELLAYTPRVTVVTNGNPLAMDKEYQERLAGAGIPILERKAASLEGENGLERLVLDNGQILEVHGLFVAMGEASSLDFAYSLGLERNGVFIVADKDQKTNVPGVFAAGDCVGNFMQIGVAVGEGVKAGRSAISHVKKICRA